MAKVMMNQEGVNALKTLATSLPEASQMITDASELLRSSFEEKKEVLGPHSDQIEEILDTIHKAQAEGQKSVVKLQRSLAQAAVRLAEILAKSLKWSAGNP